jgi:ribokinase
MIVAFGSINLDLIFPLPHLPAAGETVLGREMVIEPGGKGANQAVAAARDGAQVVFVGAIGADALANDALRLMRATDMDTTRIAVTSAATGCAAICVDTQGRNLIAVASGANLAARQTQVEDELLGPGTTLLLQMECPRADTEELIRRARLAGSRIVLNLAPAAVLEESALRSLDVLVVNEGEAAFLARYLGCATEAAVIRERLGGVQVVITLGESGLEAATTQGHSTMPAHPVAVLDTTGAGDCFTGVLASGLDRGLAMETALARANAAAGLCCSRRGTQGSMPLAEETSAALS